MLLRCGSVVFAAALLVAVGRPLTAHDGPHDGPTTASFRVARDGSISFREDVTLADALVPNGKDRFAHRIEGDVHVSTLTRIQVRSQTDTMVYDVSTSLMPGRRPRTRSVLRAKEAADHALHVSVIEVAGEANDHIPRARPGTR